MSNDEYIDNTTPSDESLQSIAKLAREFVAADVHIRSLKMELEKVEKYYEEISTVKLPDAMNAIGMAEFKLSNGYTLSVIPVFNVRLPKNKIDAADEWLDNNGHSGMIKRVLQVAINNEIPSDVVEKLKIEIEEQGFEYEEVKNVHWATIQSWANEMKTEGEIIPEEIFTVYRGNKTTITE